MDARPSEWVPPRWIWPVALMLGVIVGALGMYAAVGAKLETVQSELSQVKGAEDATDKGLGIRIDALKSEYDLLHKEVTDARIVQAQHAPVAK